MKDLSVVFMGTPEFAVPVLDMLIRETNVKLVVCQPDKFVGRKKEIVFSPIKKLALDNNIEVFQPAKIKEDYDKIIDLKPDIIITCAYGQIIPTKILECPKYGCINVHGSLLPKLRGGAPIHHAIINGDKETGITIMYMDKLRGILQEVDYVRVSQKFNQERLKLNEQKQELEQKLIETEDKIESKNHTKEEKELDKLIEEFLKFEKPDKMFLYRLINKIEIDKDKNIYIYFNFSKLNSINENLEEFIKIEELINENQKCKVV